jgi:hypothetical protein
MFTQAEAGLFASHCSDICNGSKCEMLALSRPKVLLPQPN